MEKMIDLLILYVTHRCNSRCKTCFYWKSLNSQGKELSFKEMQKISRRLGPFTTMLLGGGEPTLREDIVDIAELFYKNNHVRDFSIPTNCLLPGKIAEIAGSLLKRCPDAVINIGLSLDGTEDVHDSIRGVKGNFKKVLDAELRLRKLSGNKNLIVKILTTITSENYDNLPKLMEVVRKNMKVKWHYFEPIRGEPREEGQKGLTFVQLRDLNRKIRRNYRYYYGKGVMNKLRMYFDLYNISAAQRNQEQFFRDGTMSRGCTAGTSSAVIEPTGDVRLCELLPAVGNIREADYDFGKIWRGEKARQQRKFIRGKKCACTHCVFLEKTMLSKLVGLIKWR